MEGHMEVVKVLLKAHAKIDKVTLDRSRSTPLMLAAQEGHHDIVNLLILCSANVDKNNSYGLTALHIGSMEGHMEVVKVLLKAHAKIDKVTLDRSRSTPLMLAARKGHQNIITHLITCGASVDKKDLNNRTALHYASERGNLEMVKLLLNAGAKIDGVDICLPTPLMLATCTNNAAIISYMLNATKQDVSRQTVLCILAGHLPSGSTSHEVNTTKLNKCLHSECQLGREVFSCAINQKYEQAAKVLIAKGVGIEGLLSTSPSMTALMWTAREGDDTLTKQLILQGVNINYQNPGGLTSLHFASQHNHIQCGILLVEAGADVSAVNKASQTPLDLSSREFKEAILQTLSFQTKKAVCVIGNAMSGKSTLVASLQNENASFVKKIRNRLFGVGSITKRTAGIEPVSLSSKRYGDVMFFDFAGQHEYHGPHEMFLESILSKGLSTVTIIVVVKATENESDISHQLNRWLHPFSKTSSSANPVRVIVIGSHMDKVKRKAEAKEKLELCYKRVKDSLRDAPLEFKDLCYLDCRQPYSSDITKLCAYLNDVPPPQYKARDTAYSITWVTSQIRSSFEDKVIPVSSFSEWIAHNKANLPTNLPPAEEVCKDLSSTGHFLYLPSKEGTSNGWLVLDLPSILHEVYGTLFSPSKKIVNKFGLLSCQRLSVLFPTLDPSMVHDVLISLEFCVEVDPSILPEAIHMMDSSDEGHKHLFFPALVSAEPPKAFDPPSEASHTLSWQLVVNRDVFISPRLLQTIILRLAAHHIFHELEGSKSREHHSKVWWNGIFWQSTKDVDAAVQISDNAVIQVIGRSEVGPEVLCAYISTLTEDIFATIRDLSPRLSGTAYVIHSVNPQVLLEHPRSPSPQEMFPVDVIMASVKNDGRTTLSLGTGTDAAVRKPISEIFGGFEPSMEVIERLSMPQCSPPPTNQPDQATSSPQSTINPLPRVLTSSQPNTTESLLTTPADPLETTPTSMLQYPLQTTPTDPLQTTPTDPLQTTPTDPFQTTPSMSELQQLIIRHIALEWQSIGLELDIEVSVLQIIEEDNPRSVERCCRTMFTRWLVCDEGTGGEPRVWRTVLKALKNAGYMTLVGDVERILFEQN
jgi:ankyrin repeat protein/GTPase SAR1 family protein